MKIKTTMEIMKDGENIVMSGSPLSKSTIALFTSHQMKRWIGVDDLLVLINKLEIEGSNSGSGFSSYELKESLNK